MSSLCRVVSIGKVSPWGKTFLEGLQREELIELQVYPTTKAFLTSENSAFPHIVFVENFPESRHWIVELRESHFRVYIVLFGEKFSKEDLAFALENRVYRTFENIDPSSYEALEYIKKLAEFVEKEKKFDILVRSLKTVLLEAEGDVANAVMGELKSAVDKLGTNGGFSEFSYGEDRSENVTSETQVFPETDGIVDVLQTIDSLERTGVLWVKGTHAGQEGQIEFLQGKIVAASAGPVNGLKAIYRMFLWDSVKFAFSRRRQDEMELNDPINASIHMVAMEGIRYRGQFNRFRHQLPPGEIVLELDPNYLHPGMNLPPNDFSTLASVVEFGKVSQILDYTPLPDVVLYESLINLRKLNVIRIAA